MITGDLDIWSCNKLSCVLQAVLRAAFEREQLSSRQVRGLEEAKGRLEAEAQCSAQREVELRRRVWAQETLVIQARVTKLKLELVILNQSAQHKVGCDLLICPRHSHSKCNWLKVVYTLHFGVCFGKQALLVVQYCS